MKNKRIIPINFINLVIIVSIMIVVAILTQNIINELTLKDIHNITRLTQTNIYAEVVKEFAEPVNTSVVMAQNSFMFNTMNDDTLETEEALANYLTAIQDVTGYDSVFVVPHSTLSYYHPGGTDAKVDLKSDASFWYKERIDSEDEYSIVVNTEQLDDWALTVYIDATIRGAEGNFAGVTGVGKRITHLQDILSRYISNQGVEAYLVDSEGLIQVHRDLKLIKNSTFYDLEEISSEEFKFQENEALPLERQVGQKFLVFQYIPMLDWYLVVTKSTSQLATEFNKYSSKVYVSLVIASVMMMLGTSVTIGRYKKQIVNLSNIDQLTNIPNRTIFDSVLKESIKNKHSKEFCLALFDVDNLKNINDDLGHDKGDFALRRIADIAGKYIIEPDILSRIGGDEFALIIFGSLIEVKKLLEDFHAEVNRDIELKGVNATISIGIAKVLSTDTESSIYKRADEALYQSKASGKNSIK